jgi:hypothetical protein
MQLRCPQSERCPLLHPSRTLPAGVDRIDAPAAIDTGDPATMVTMDPAIMDPATMVGGGQVWGSMSDLVGVGGISLLSSDRLSALTAGKPRLANGAESHRTTSLGYAHST